MNKPRRKQFAFTLIELLVVTAIIGVLAAILFPIMASARAAARRTTCITQLRQIGLGLAMYRQDWEVFPPRLSTLVPTEVSDPRIFVCPSDRQRGIHDGNERLEGKLFLATGVSYDYVPRWKAAVDLGWWTPGPTFGQGKWDDLTPIADCQWHWAGTFNANWSDNAVGARGWQMVLTAGGSVRKIRVEEPLSLFTPDRYR